MSFPQRVLAAFLAIGLRFETLNPAALACPPLDAPGFDSATAATVSGVSTRQCFPAGAGKLSIQDGANGRNSELGDGACVLGAGGHGRLERETETSETDPANA